ncbi:hypothetical protein L1276_000506 [Flavobacterium sp. HSC-32F16]|nr:hypothetical protein [Flavobacterium sp. HSC-32F16]MCP2025366.1 hypothetical protein [Flavobacterium sp. HSC-32F16]
MKEILAALIQQKTTIKKTSLTNTFVFQVLVTNASNDVILKTDL